MLYSKYTQKGVQARVSTILAVLATSYFVPALDSAIVANSK